ncbi:MAG: 1-deoxy-D-xylulose-5-phosphate synthase [Ruminococcaceae bacterium]|nr:1-deoxy-D-xylulose-5-phosphate synthase [Oscillospiraceae bacterium]
MSHEPILNRVSCPADLHDLTAAERTALCEEIRQFLLSHIAETGGHLASNLGAVELTVALHMEYDTARDRLVFDVGHQAYVHKLLTGRREGFANLRRFGGMSGFPKPEESIHDAFIAGHASTSISAATGMARARTLLREQYDVVALIGDGALSGGMAYEALNDAGRSGEPLVVVLNDNDMSISKSVGAIAQYLSRIRLRPSYTKLKNGVKRALRAIPGGKRLERWTHNFKKRFKYLLLPATIFEDMGFQYVGPADGHDIEEVRRLLRYAKEQHCPVLVHVKTVKGKGYRFSQEKPETFHGTGSFDPETGRPLKESVPTTFSDVFGAELSAIAAEEPRVCAITAAMPVGTGLSGFAERFPERFIDVGIAEEHAVTMAAGMAKQGMIPVVALYSTFLQRAYDQLIHDAAIHPLHMVFCIDRAGISGEDGETHQGLFDPAFLATIPHMTILCPANDRELRRALRRAIFEETGPVAIRYPKGRSGAFRENSMDEPAPCLMAAEEPRAVLLSYGILINPSMEAAQALADAGIPVSVIKCNCIKPLPVPEIRRAMGDCRRLFVIEDTIENGSVSQRLAAALPDCRVSGLTAGDAFLRCGSVAELQTLLGLDAAGIADRIKKELTE